MRANERADLSLHRAHLSEGTLSHVVAQIHLKPACVGLHVMFDVYYLRYTFI